MTAIRDLCAVVFLKTAALVRALAIGRPNCCSPLARRDQWDGPRYGFGARPNAVRLEKLRPGLLAVSCVRSAGSVGDRDHTTNHFIFRRVPLEDQRGEGVSGSASWKTPCGRAGVAAPLATG